CSGRKPVYPRRVTRHDLERAIRARTVVDDDDLVDEIAERLEAVRDGRLFLMHDEASSQRLGHTIASSFHVQPRSLTCPRHRCKVRRHGEDPTRSLEALPAKTAQEPLSTAGSQRGR